MPLGMDFVVSFTNISVNTSDFSSVDLVGTKVKHNVDVFRKRLGLAFERAVGEAAAFILEKSNDIAPIEQGDLIKDSFVAVTKAGVDSSAQIGYGPPDSPSNAYAAIQHEMYEIKRVEGREWKYLTSALERNRGRMRAIVESNLEKVAQDAARNPLGQYRRNL